MKGDYTWRIDLCKTEKHWSGWFQGLSKKFLSIHAQKLLLLANIDRMDKDLIVGQMQGNTILHVLLSYDLLKYCSKDEYEIMKTLYVDCMI